MQCFPSNQDRPAYPSNCTFISSSFFHSVAQARLKPIAILLPQSPLYWIISSTTMPGYIRLYLKECISILKFQTSNLRVLGVLQGQVTPGVHASLRRPVRSSTTPPRSTHCSWRIEASLANFLGLFPAFAKLAPDHLTQLCCGCLCEVCLYWFQICHWLCLPASLKNLSAFVCWD